MKNKSIYILIVILSIMISPFFSNGQVVNHNPEIEGTYTIATTSVKLINENSFKLTDDYKSQITKNRKENVDFLIEFDDFSILIMSREKMEADLKWAKYSLIKK